MKTHIDCTEEPILLSWLMMTRLCLTALVLLGSGALSDAQQAVVPAWPGTAGCRLKSTGTPTPGPAAPATLASASIDVVYYTLDLRISVTPAYLEGSAGLTARCLADTVSSIILDLSGPMRVDSVIAGSKRTSFIRYNQAVEILLDRTYQKNETIRAVLFYQGIPSQSGFGSFVFAAHSGVPWVWSLSEPYGARDWWPCKDHPSDKADSVDIRIRCDARFKVGSNGRRLAVVNNGDGSATTTWSERYPIAPYLVSVTLTNFEEFTNWFRYSATDSMPILNYVLPEHLGAALSSLPKTVDMLEIFSNSFGLYPFIAEKYGHCEFGAGGAMEHQTMTSTTTFNEITIAHELGHQWFGDLITCANWHELWLNEGFATYTEAVYLEKQYGPAWYRSHMQEQMNDALSAEGTLYLQDTTSVRDMFANSRVYAKGGAVLHMLRHVLGDSTFSRALRAYVADPRFRFAVATTRDFQQVCEVVSGQSLGYFFDEWVFGEKYPVYTFSWKTWNESGQDFASVTIDQVTRTDNPRFFTMPVDIQMKAAGWDTTISVMHQFSGQVFQFALPARPDSVILDPGDWVLKQVLPSEVTLPQEIILMQNYPNPFNAGTVIVYRLPSRMQVNLRVFNALGQQVATLVDEREEPGSRSVQWDGRSDRNVPQASGTYLYRLATERGVRTGKMVLVR